MRKHEIDQLADADIWRLYLVRWDHGREAPKGRIERLIDQLAAKGMKPPEIREWIAKRRTELQGMS